MAIDTETKRRSVLHVLPVADSAIGAEDRRVVAGGYWLAAAAAVAKTAAAYRTVVLSSRRMVHVLSSRKRTGVPNG